MEEHGIRGRVLRNSSRDNLEERTKQISSQLDIRDLMKQGHSPEEAAEIVSRDICKKLGLNYEVDDVSNMGVIKGGEMTFYDCVKEAGKFMWFSPTFWSQRLAYEGKDFQIGRFLCSVMVTSSMNLAFFYSSIAGDYKAMEEPVGTCLRGLVGSIPIATNIASGIYEYARYTKNKMREEKKAKRGDKAGEEEREREKIDRCKI